ncbi:MAG: phospholipase D-like domain-containing protein [Lentimicrobium sp.]|jgi:phosphatidylserine/phosphatidylglycerophosphate/cardiolipin synthase-like enzyme|nr:phospholipase D-like domain-containing protein [Lentimicrobium sp.]
MKKTLLIALAFLGFTSINNAQNTILEARGMAVGSVVTVKGIVTNGAEFGVIRYLQDNTAGIAAYGPLTMVANRGDSVSVTGTLKNYNQLLEIDPVSSFTVLSTGHPVPAPIVITPGQIAEAYESRLVKINNVIFTDAGNLFTGNKKYEFTSNGQNGYIYIKNDQTDIVGQPIPSGNVNITAICSQFDYSNPNAGYQLLPRTIDDIEQTSSIFFTNTLTNTNFTKAELDFTWTTNISGSTEIFYGLSEESVTANHSIGTGGNAAHEIFLTGLSAGQVIWVNAFSVSGSDTAFSGVTPFATISNSSGDIKVYFNTAVDHDYSHGVDAIVLPNTVDDTLISYINRAKYSIDFTMYNFNNSGISNVSNALKAAADRGVTVRVIGCGTTANLGIDELAGSAVNVLIGPSGAQRTGIMHNKFILFDVESADANEPLVWTGSTNLTSGQVNTDANNVIIIQDQSLARTYKIEFEEMWGSKNSTPNATNARFSFNKKNNTPHEFIINGKRVECYFSPTDGVNAKIVETINTASNDLSIATMLITRNEMADAIAARKAAGVAVNVLTNAEGNNGALVNTVLSGALGTHYVFDNVVAGIMHHKYMVVDQDASASDPLAFTGSHNWSAAADNDNDENTLIVHDATTANLYYQNFVKRFIENDGVLLELTGPPTAVNDTVTLAMDQEVTVEVLLNDIKQSPVSLSIEIPAVNGNSYIPFTNTNVINYKPAAGFKGVDSVTYKIAYLASPDLSATANIYIYVVTADGFAEGLNVESLVIYPNPVIEGGFQVTCTAKIAEKVTYQLFDITGKQVENQSLTLNSGGNVLNISTGDLKSGIYFLRFTTSTGVYNQKLIVR